jgi:hypothetical protein
MSSLPFVSKEPTDCLYIAIDMMEGSSPEHCKCGLTIIDPATPLGMISALSNTLIADLPDKFHELSALHDNCPLYIRWATPDISARFRSFLA